jgi:hypothetical protein
MKRNQIVIRSLFTVLTSCFAACSDKVESNSKEQEAVESKPNGQDAFTHDEWVREETNDGIFKYETSYFHFMNHSIPAGGYVSRVDANTKEKICDRAQYRLGIQYRDGKSGMNECFFVITKYGNDYYRADKLYLRTSEAMECSSEYLKETIEPSIKVEYKDDVCNKFVRFTSAGKDSSKVASVDVGDLFDSREAFASVKKMSFGVKTGNGELVLEFDARCVAELMSELESIAKRHNDTIKFFEKIDGDEMLGEIIAEAITESLNKKKKENEDLK